MIEGQTKMSMMDDIEQLKHENAELIKAFKVVETLLNQIGQMAAATAGRAQGINRMLVFKGVCTHEELASAEMNALLELTGQVPPKQPGIVDPKQQELVKPN